MKAFELLSIKKEDILKVRRFQAFLLESNLHFLNEKLHVAKIISDTYNIDRSIEIIQNGSKTNYWFEALEQDIYYDLVSMTESPILNKCLIGFLPSIKGGAIVQKTDEHEFLIAINIGMLYISQLICHAIVLESNEKITDNSPYQLFQSACRLFIADTLSKFKVELDFYTSIVQLEQQIEVASITTKIMQFIALHELAHIELGHINSKCSSSEIKNNYKLEFQADEFAFDIIWNNSTCMETKWNHSFWIYVFFLALDYIEWNMKREICPRHPKPQKRANKIKELCLSRLNDINNKTFHWIDFVFNSWKGNYMNNPITASIQTQYPESILSIFKGDNLLVCDGFKIELISMNEELGFLDSETVINVAIYILDVSKEIIVLLALEYILNKFGNVNNINHENRTINNIIKIDNVTLTEENKKDIETSILKKVIQETDTKKDKKKNKDKRSKTKQKKKKKG